MWLKSKRSELNALQKTAFLGLRFQPGIGGREGGSKINAHGLIVFPDGLRMYPRRHLYWRTTLHKLSRGKKGKVNRTGKV